MSKETKNDTSSSTETEKNENRKENKSIWKETERKFSLKEERVRKIEVNNCPLGNWNVEIIAPKAYSNSYLSIGSHFLDFRVTVNVTACGKEVKQAAVGEGASIVLVLTIGRVGFETVLPLPTREIVLRDVITEPQEAVSITAALVPVPSCPLSLSYRPSSYQSVFENRLLKERCFIGAYHTITVSVSNVAVEPRPSRPLFLEPSLAPSSKAGGFRTTNVEALLDSVDDNAFWEAVESSIEITATGLALSRREKLLLETGSYFANDTSISEGKIVSYTVIFPLAFSFLLYLSLRASLYQYSSVYVSHSVCVFGGCF